VEIPLLKDILIIFALAIAVLLVCHRLRVPSIVGFLRFSWKDEGAPPSCQRAIVPRPAAGFQANS
jgi:hypothetical protein